MLSAIYSLNKPYTPFRDHQRFQSQVYRDQDTISVGFGFNVKYLDEDDYKFFEPNQVERLKELQQKLLKNAHLITCPSKKINSVLMIIQ